MVVSLIFGSGKIARSSYALGMRSAAACSLSTTKGLTEFFDDPKGWRWGEVDQVRAWKEEELERKSFSDLHMLWWVCVKEKNKLLSQKAECELYRFLFPRTKTLEKVNETMTGIRNVLHRRLLERRRALKALEIVERQRLSADDNGEIEISKEQREEIMFSGFDYKQKKRHKQAIREMEKERKMKSFNPNLEEFKVI